MDVEFNLKEIQKLFTDFYHLCNLREARLALLDAKYQMLFEYPIDNRMYCTLIRANLEGAHLCSASEQYGFFMAQKSKEDYVMYCCHAGLTHVCFAVKYEGQVVGYFFIGSFLLDEVMNNSSPEELLQKCAALIPEKERFAWKAALQDMDILSTHHINAIIHIMRACINNMIYQSMIKIRGDSVWEKIDAYVGSNLNRQFSLSDMSRELFVSVSTISHKTKDITGKSIGNYILRRRMSLASDYLQNTDYCINQIAELVGMADYNYFSRVFKKTFGVSPSRFRKTHRLDTEKEKLTAMLVKEM